MAGFASKVMLGDLDDFIIPSQACTNPLFTETGGNQTGAAKISLDVDDMFGGFVTYLILLYLIRIRELVRPNLIKATAQNTAKVSLNDCLACSGCVTSAETVLISQQSGEEFLSRLRGGQVGYG